MDLVIIIFCILGGLFLLGTIMVSVGFDLISLVLGIVKVAIIGFAIFGFCAIFI